MLLGKNNCIEVTAENLLGLKAYSTDSRCGTSWTTSLAGLSETEEKSRPGSLTYYKIMLFSQREAKGCTARRN
jgi:hypothetical protein